MDVSTVVSAPREIGCLRAEDWPLRPLIGEVIGREKAFQVIIRQSVLAAIAEHGKSSSNVEVCGVLVGNVYSDGSAPYAAVDAAIIGQHSAGRSTQVTFTSETWTHINDVRDRDYPDKQILGWYHTHPGFGIFLSEMDLFIHQSFFSEPWQLAFVFDPKSGEEGLFLWRDGKVVQDGFLVEHDVPGELAPAAEAQEPPATPTGIIGDLSARVQVLERRLKLLAAGGALAVLIAIVWPLVLAILMQNGLAQSSFIKGPGSFAGLPISIPGQSHPLGSASIPATQPSTQPTTDPMIGP